jgi:hypothetical protein
MRGWHIFARCGCLRMQQYNVSRRFLLPRWIYGGYSLSSRYILIQRPVGVLYSLRRWLFFNSWIYRLRSVPCW